MPDKLYPEFKLLTQIMELQSKFGKNNMKKKQLIISAHYAKLKEMQVSSTYRKAIINIRQHTKHLRPLQTPGKNIENNLIMVLIHSKFPKQLLAKLK